MNKSRFTRHTVMVAVVLFGVGGCSDGGTQSDTATGGVSQSASSSTKGEVSLPVGEEEAAVKDQSRWTMPLDPYWAPRTMNLESQASSLLISGCMSEAGFPEYKPYWDMNAPAPENEAGNGIGVFFNEDLAAKYGYHMAPDPRYVIGEEVLAAGDEGLWPDASEEFDNQLGQCIEDADKQMGTDPGVERPTDGITSQMNQMSWPVLPEAVAEAEAKWRECMAPLGIADLPNGPWDAGGSGAMPESLVVKWDWRPFGDPSQDEIDTAVFDAQCRRSSGWFDAYYDAEWEFQEAFVTEHKDDLAPLLEQNKENAKHFEQIIKEHSNNTQ